MNLAGRRLPDTWNPRGRRRVQVSRELLVTMLREGTLPHRTNLPADATIQGATYLPLRGIVELVLESREWEPGPEAVEPKLFEVEVNP